MNIWIEIVVVLPTGVFLVFMFCLESCLIFIVLFLVLFCFESHSSIPPTNHKVRFLSKTFYVVSWVYFLFLIFLYNLNICSITWWWQDQLVVCKLRKFVEGLWFGSSDYFIISFSFYLFIYLFVFLNLVLYLLFFWSLNFFSNSLSPSPPPPTPNILLFAHFLFFPLCTLHSFFSLPLYILYPFSPCCYSFSFLTLCALFKLYPFLQSLTSTSCLHFL